jgi:hypothetical protein
LFFIFTTFLLICSFLYYIQSLSPVLKIHGLHQIIITVNTKALLLFDAQRQIF